LFGVLYLAITAGGTASKDAYKSLAIVGGWIVIGVIWVAINPGRHHAKKVVSDRTERAVTEASVPVTSV
jgi:hypothetical protein